MNTRTRRHPTPRLEYRCKCGQALQRFWPFCPACGRDQVWSDDPPITGAECYYCGWVVSDVATYCPWCGEKLPEIVITPPEPTEEQVRKWRRQMKKMARTVERWLDQIEAPL